VQYFLNSIFNDLQQNGLMRPIFSNLPGFFP
jgi:hypothetical protein